MTDIDAQASLELQYITQRARRKGLIFPLPVDLSLGEDIRGAAMRAVARNGFNDTYTVVELTRSRSFRSIAAVHESASAADLHRLVEVLGIRTDAENVRQLLAREPTTSRDLIRFSGVNIRRGHLAKQRRVAPRSLKVIQRQKAVWALRPFGFDLATGERLLDHCPECGKELGWRRSFGVCFCDKCTSADDPLRGSVDLREFEQPIESIADGEAIHLFRTLVDPEAHAGHPSLHPDLAELSRAELFQLAIKIARPSGNQGWLRSLDVQEIERAGRALLSWPSAFDELAEGELTDEHSPEIGRWGFDRVQDDNKLSRRVRLLVKQRSDARLRKAVVRNVSEQADLEARPFGLRRARGHRAELKRLATTSTVTAHEAAVALLRSSAEYRRLSADLGVPLPWLTDLYAQGMLPQLEAELESLLPRPVRPTIPWLETVGNIPSIRTAPYTFSLHSAFFALLNWNGSSCAALFRAVSDGTLKASVIAGSTLPIAQRISCLDFDASMFASRLQTGCSASDLVPLTQGDVAIALGKPRSVVRAFMRNGLLSPSLSWSEVMGLRKDWMFLTEVLDLARLIRRQDLGCIRYSLIHSAVARETLNGVTLWSRVGVREHLAADGLPINHDFG